MDVYTFCLTLGFVGLAAMVALGAFHLGDHHGHGGHGHSSDFNLHGSSSAPTGALSHGAMSHGAISPGGAGTLAGGHALSGSNGLAHHTGQTQHGGQTPGAQTSGAHPAQHSHGQHETHSLASRFDIFSLLSPRLWFSVMLGFGATGLLIKHQLPLEPWRFLLAMCGGVGFEKLLMGPTWNVWMSFASQPARTLESAVAEEARAATNFDADGHGLIALDLDGQVLQVLGRLSEGQRREGVTVRNGDRLFVEDVDAARNRCVVSKLD